MTKTMTPKEIAVQFETDGRTVRKFLRSITPVEDRPGKGSRWAIESRSTRTLRKQFDTWLAAKAAKAAEEATEAEEDEMLEGEDSDTDTE